MPPRPPIVTRQSELERLSFRKLDDALSPWLVTKIDTSDDYGRDAIVQIVDPDGTVPPFALFVQLKATDAPFAVDDRLQVKTRHLLLWSEGTDVWVFFFSRSDDSFRARSGKALALEVDAANPGWREQQTITIRFPKETEVGGSLSLAEIRRRIADQEDRDGGTRRFRSHRRRVVLTDLYVTGVRYTTSLEFSAEGEAGSLRGMEGVGWMEGDLDAADVDAKRVLSSSLLLYEEVWIIGSFLVSALAALGPWTFRSLVERDRLRLFGLDDHLVYCVRNDEQRGTVESFSIRTQRDPIDDWQAKVEPLGGDRSLAELIMRKMTRYPAKVAAAIVGATHSDLESDEIRRLVGLSEFRSPDHTEPVWDGRLVARLLFLNTCLAGAEQLLADVVEFESGLSRIASTKWYSELRFHRLYETADAFDSALRACGVPDLGLVAASIGMDKMVEAADTQAAQEFRDWFWTEVAPAAIGGGDSGTRVIQRAAKLIGIDFRSIRLGAELKLRLVEANRTDYVLGSYGLQRRPGFSSRSRRSSYVLRRQAEIHRRRREELIRLVVGRLPGAYAPCPCQSGEKYRFCCGGPLRI